jgi:Raf kinase inhibitor-like YbhB/YbcL family protein
MSLKLGKLHISSSAFEPEGRIPKKYAGDGDNLSPPLEWDSAPSGTKQFAVICYDPDAPLPRAGFIHWVLYGIPGNVTKLAEGQGADAFVAGNNGMGKPGYMGPYPPNGHGLHHYYFWVYALDADLKLKQGLTLEQLWTEIGPHVLEQARVVGLYER